MYKLLNDLLYFCTGIVSSYLLVAMQCFSHNCGFDDYLFMLLVSPRTFRTLIVIHMLNVTLT